MCLAANWQRKNSSGSVRDGGECSAHLRTPGYAHQTPRLCREALDAQIAERAAQRQRARRALLHEAPPAWLAPASTLTGPGVGPPGALASTSGPLVSRISAAAQPAARPAGSREGEGREQGVDQAPNLARGLKLPPLAPWQTERLAAQAGGGGTVAGSGSATAPADTFAKGRSSNAWPPERSDANGRQADAAGASANESLYGGRHGADVTGGSSPAPTANPGDAALDSPQRMGRRPAAIAASKPTFAVDTSEAWPDDPYRAGRLGRGRGQFSPERRSVAADALAGDASWPAQAWNIGAGALPNSGGAAQHATGRKAVPVRVKLPSCGCQCRHSAPN